MRGSGKGERRGALWHIFQRRDTDKVRAFLSRHRKRFGQHARSKNHGADSDPIFDQNFYLSSRALALLLEEEGVEPWSILQGENDAVIVPAGCAHQVRNLSSCIKVRALPSDLTPTPTHTPTHTHACTHAHTHTHTRTHTHAHARTHAHTHTRTRTHTHTRTHGDACADRLPPLVSFICFQVALDFVSPESVSEVITLTNAYRKLPDRHFAKHDKVQAKLCVLNAAWQALPEREREARKEREKKES